MAVNWSREQRQVIEHRDGSLLVSAAAGSGKTAVLVERIIRMIKDGDHPMDIDRLLVVTFTDAAAAEMRQRVTEAIEKALEQSPDSIHLQRQRTLIHNAKIMTMHSFCLYVIRSQFHRIGLEPGFRIADEAEIRLLKEDVLKEALEDFYGGVYAQELPMEQFYLFAESFAPGKNDAALREMILDLYEYAMSYPWPGEWLGQMAKAYEEADESAGWMRELTAYLKLRVREITGQIREALALCREPDGPSMYESALASDAAHWEKSENCATFTQLYHWQKDVVFEKLGRGGKYKGSGEKRNAVKDIRDQAKEEMKELRERFFFEEPREQFAHLRQAAPHARTLTALTLKFMEVFEQKKREKNLLDFHDQEHLALRILIDPETKEPTGAAREYKNQFDQIMVDEYQDSNYVQEALVRSVSKDGRNIFMVGDVKQSIYRFRLARPELFMEKFDSYRLREPDTGEPEEVCEEPEQSVTEKGRKEKDSDDPPGRRIDLHRNFRSREQVTGFINHVCSGIMGRDLGNVEYDEKAALRPGAVYPEGLTQDYEPELILADSGETGEDKVFSEARAAAGKIREMAGNIRVLDNETGGLRPAAYGDMVILMRSITGRSEVFMEVFVQEGIPLATPSRTGYFAALEVRTILSVLQIIDNPMQDIPLAAVLKSPIVGMTSEELARIRAAHPSGSFYEAAKNAGGNNEKLSAFFARLTSFRERVPYTPIHSLLEQIYEETGYLDYVTVMPAGGQRRANLQMLLEKAVAYEKTSYRGLFHFMRYMDQLHKYEMDFGEAEGAQGASDAVRLMTIHKSKGLEFPIVLLCGMGKQFNRQDESSAIIFHPEYGVGFDLIDPDRRVKTPLLLKQAFRRMIREENLGEEMRVLYVAMTRAREKLVLVGNWDENRVRRCMGQNRKRRYDKNERLSYGERYHAACYLDWVLPMLPDHMEIQRITPQLQTEKEAAVVIGAAELRGKAEEAIETCDLAWKERIEKRFSWKYKFEKELFARPKVSVSELKHRAMEELFRLQEDEPMEDTVYYYERPPVIPYIPKFENRADEVSQGALRGTAAHRFLECLDFAGRMERSVAEWTEIFVQRGRMSAEQAGLLPAGKLERFLEHPVAARMEKAARAGVLYRERPFVMGRPPKELNMPGEDLALVQGIIDVFWKEEDGVALLDYKTDAVKQEQELIDRYETQLKLYRKAAEQALHLPVKEALIYSFALGRVIRIE